MNKIRFSAALAGAFAMIVSASQAQELLLHFPMESADDGLGKLYSREGGAVAVPGKVGKALSFDREAVLALPFNLDHQDYPQVTVTAWVKQDDGASGSRTVFHSGSTAGLAMAVNGGTLAMRTGGPGVSYSGDKLPNREWVFIAAVLDTSAGLARLHQNDGEPTIRDDLDIDTKEPRKFLDPDDSEAGKTPYVFVGGNDFKTFYGTSRDLAIDDVRVYAGVLSDEQIAAIRAGDASAVGKTGETEKNVAGDQYACRRLPGEQYACKTLPGDQYDFASLPGDQYVYDQLPGDQYDPRELPGDQYACRRLSGDQYACKQLPGDQYDFAALPGDQYDPRELPGEAQTAKAIGETEKNDAGEEESASLRKRPGRTLEQQGERSVGQVPDDLMNTDIGAPSQAPELEPTADRSVDQLPEEIENPDVSRLPTGAPDPQYDSPEAAEKAARQREEAEAAAEETRDQQQGLEAVGTPRPVGELKYSAISGYQGDDTQIHTLFSESDFLHEISWWERGDKPCAIRFNYEEYVRGCTFYNERSQESVRLFQGNDLPDYAYAVTAIEVCSSFNSNNRLKGIRIFGSRIMDDGSIVYQPLVNTAERRNCSEWHRRVLCPTDTVATGLITHQNDKRSGGLASPEFEIVGLQLICRAITVK